MTHFSKICSVNFPSDTQIKITADHPLPPEPTLEDWRDLATAMLAELARAPRANWAFIEQVTADGRVPEEVPQVTDAEDMETVVAQETALAEDEDKAEVDAMLDRLEEELEGINSAAAPLLDPWQARTTTYRPRAAVLLAVLRLAKTFGTADFFAEATATPGSLTVICTGSSQLDKQMVKLLQRLICDCDEWGKTSPDTYVTSAVDAVRGSGGDSGQVFGSLSEGMRNALERGGPVVIVATTDAMLQSNLKGLSPQIVPVMPLDRDILQALLSYAYPESPIDGKVMAGLPLDAVVSRLDAESLTLALRAKDPVTALQNIATFITPVKSDGLGLADFPLPAEVRGPVEQLVADMRAWQAGEIPWRDVSRGLLLVGPPGSGKTEIPRLIAKEAGITVVAGSVAQWSSEGSRGSEVIKAMRNSFAKAAAQAPAVLFLDEIDAFGDRLRAQDHNSAWTDHIVTALLDALDGYHGHEGVVVIAATNHLGKVDAAVCRPGRFDTTVTLGYPDHHLMPQAIRWQLAGDLPDADLSGVAVAAVGMSGAEVAALVRAARALARKDRRALTVEDLSTAVAAIRPPLSEQLHWRVALHEAGHAIVGAATGFSKPQTLAILPTGGVSEQRIQTGAGSRDEVEKRLAIDLAG